VERLGYRAKLKLDTPKGQMSFKAPLICPEAVMSGKIIVSKAFNGM
jgi:hypothetical protein